MNKIMLNHFLVFLVVGLLLMLVPPLGSAQLVFQRDKNINMVIPCTIDGYPCSGSATCNLTIIYPNSSYLVNNLIMSNGDNGDFNRTVLYPVAGTYQAEVPCQQGGQNATSNFEVKINEAGEDLTTAQGITYMIFLLAILFTFSLTLYGAIKIPFRNPRGDDGVIININDLKYLKIFLFVVSYIILMFIFGIVKSITENFLYLNGASKVFNWLYWIMFSFMWPLMVMSIIFTLILFLQGKKLKAALDRGIRLR